MNEPKTLHQIIFEVLEKYPNANLKSDSAKESIADDICKLYYDQIDIENNDLFDDSELNNMYGNFIEED